MIASNLLLYMDCFPNNKCTKVIKVCHLGLQSVTL